MAKRTNTLFGFGFSMCVIRVFIVKENCKVWGMHCCRVYILATSGWYMFKANVWNTLLTNPRWKFVAWRVSFDTSSSTSMFVMGSPGVYCYGLWKNCLLELQLFSWKESEVSIDFECRVKFHWNPQVSSKFLQRIWAHPYWNHLFSCLTIISICGSLERWYWRLLEFLSRISNLMP